MAWAFDSPGLLSDLEGADDAALDQAPFGVIAMSRDGVVSSYNAFESRLAGLSSGKVIGRHFLSAVGPCTNNFLVAQRFEDEAELNATPDYVFTFRMKPTPVRLRLLKKPEA